MLDRYGHPFGYAGRDLAERMDALYGGPIADPVRTTPAPPVEL